MSQLGRDATGIQRVGARDFAKIPTNAQDSPKPKMSTVPRLSDPELDAVAGDVLVPNTLICFILSTVPVYIPTCLLACGKSWLSSEVRSKNILSSPTTTILAERGRIGKRVEETVLVGS